MGDVGGAWLRTVAAAAGLVAAAGLQSALAETVGERAGDDLWRRETLGGDWGGLRKRLDERGIAFLFEYIGDAFGNVRGGVRRLGAYQGRLEMSLDVDLGKAAEWPGAALHATAYQIHGRGPSGAALGNLLTVSEIEARPSTRLFTLWAEQNLFDKKISLRVGQLAADDEFATSEAAGTFINSTFGWPAILAANLPSGGPAYPLAAPGARLRVQPTEILSLQAGVFSGDPAGTGAAADPQRRNASGTAFSFAGGVFVVAEAALVSREERWLAGRAGALKLGAWHHSGCFGDQRFDAGGLSLADPASSGTPRRRCGNYGGYFVFDLALARLPGGKERGINLFLRGGANPSDRNLVGWYADVGATFKGPWAERPEDTAGLAFGFARIGGQARSLDRDFASFGRARPVRDHEAVLELTYQAQIAPWWIVQPDVQFVFHPGAHAAKQQAGVTRDAAAIGLRSTVRF